MSCRNPCRLYIYPSFIHILQCSLKRSVKRTWTGSASSTNESAWSEMVMGSQSRVWSDLKKVVVLVLCVNKLVGPLVCTEVVNGPKRHLHIVVLYEKWRLHGSWGKVQNSSLQWFARFFIIHAKSVSKHLLSTRSWLQYRLLHPSMKVPRFTCKKIRMSSNWRPATRVHNCKVPTARCKGF